MKKNIVVEGKAGIRVEVVLHSISEAGQEIITFLVDHPRIVHAEELKHRQFSYSAASSRAIPSAKMAEQLTGIPVSFGKNQSGMQAGEEWKAPVLLGYGGDGPNGEIYGTPQDAWNYAKQTAIWVSQNLANAGYHKQVYNRLTEPFQMIRVLVTATETDNFYWLRNDKAADPTLQEQARCMQEAHKLSTPQVLKAGEWHLPFVEQFTYYQDGGYIGFCIDVDGVKTPVSLDGAIRVSCARCAATSFRNENYGLEKSLSVYDKLINGDKIHGGATEHCATPMEQPHHGELVGLWQDGVSHMDRDGNFWSGNFKGWIQYRKLIPNECYVKETS